MILTQAEQETLRAVIDTQRDSKSNIEDIHKDLVGNGSEVNRITLRRYLMRLEKKGVIIVVDWDRIKLTA